MRNYQTRRGPPAHYGIRPLGLPFLNGLMYQEAPVMRAGGSATTQDFVWNTTTQVPTLLMDSANAYIYADAATPAEQVNLSSGTVTYLVSDLLGSVRGVVSGSGTLTASTAYDAWGNPQTASGLTAYTPFNFAGAYTDPTGLIYLINRYYDPEVGQFISIDPGISQTQQPYAYANGNPVSLKDLTGLAVWRWWQKW
jgi:RHS repeat-associated protein